MRKPQWITVVIAVLLLFILYFFGKTIPPKKPVKQGMPASVPEIKVISADSVIIMAKKELNPDQLKRVTDLEGLLTTNSSEKYEQIKNYHQLAHYWLDSVGIFEPYAWYEAEAARLENSEKTLTFAAHLFLENLQSDNIDERRKWKALQAKDLFERSLILNPGNDSSKVGLGACYLFGNISAVPMEGIMKIREVAERDSLNVYAQLTLAKGAIISGQYDKAINRLLTVNRLQENNIEAILLLADLYERTGDKDHAINWYNKGLKYIKREDARTDIETRIRELKK